MQHRLISSVKKNLAAYYCKPSIRVRNKNKRGVLNQIIRPM